MTEIHEFEEQFVVSLPETARLLKLASLMVHPSVTRITLHGSRGLAGGYRPDSDIDLCLIVDPGGILERSSLDAMLRDVLGITLNHWRGIVETDLAAVFDTQGCGLRCFEQIAYNEKLCSGSGVDCFGLYKIQKGFNGFVEGARLDVKRMYPCLTVWCSSGCSRSGQCR